MRDKAAVGADLYLEDSPENIIALRAGGHETIVVRNSTNRDLPAPGAESWDEIETLIRERVAKWRSTTA
jgi:beta-phosphoglucomutase-like phosphatase (HAD superfamily)